MLGRQGLKIQGGVLPAPQTPQSGMILGEVMGSSADMKWNTLERNGLAMMATGLKQRKSIAHNSG